MRNFLFVFLIFNFLFLILASEARAEGATLYLSPQSGTFFVGSTFTFSIYVNTKGNEINVVEIDLKFPPDILQVTSPSTGQSFVSEWLSPFSYSNIQGNISFRGGIPGGITTSAGLVSTITFRAKSPGSAKIEFLDSSRVLLNDGKGTPLSTTVINGSYDVSIPPPEGPRVFSATHPDADIWYKNNSPVFSWEKELGVTDFSFSFSQNPQEEPDAISEGGSNFKAYENIADGVWYFHLRAKKWGIFGKTTHAVVKIDTTPPKDFSPRVDTFAHFVYFGTEDLHSGIDYYEVSVREIEEPTLQQPFFTEAISPFKIPYEKPGKYSIVVRAFDKSGNLREKEVSFRMLSPNISFIEGKGIQLRGMLFSWLTIYLFLFGLFGGLGYLIFYFSRRGKLGFRKGIKEIEEALTEIRKIEEREKEIKALKQRFEEEKAKLEEKLTPRT